MVLIKWFKSNWFRFKSFEPFGVSLSLKCLLNSDANNSRLHWPALPSLSSFSTGFLSLSSLSRKYQSSVAREEERGVFYLHLVECWRLQDLQEVMKPLQLCLAARLGTMCKWQYSMIASHLFFCNRAVTKLQRPSSQPASFCQRVLLIAPHFAAMDLCIIWSHKNPEIGIPFWTFPVDNCSVHCDTFSAKTLVPLGIWHLGFLGTLFLGLLIMFRFYSGNWVKQP